MSSFSPRLTTSRLPDYTDLRRFVEFPAWRDLPPAEKARALFDFLCSPDTGLYPVQGVYEDADPGPVYSFYDERDLVKIFNVHGHGYCGLLGPVLDGVFAHAGFEDSRIFGMHANHHTVTEVFYDGAWHYFDLDLRGLLLREDGSVADLQEACSRRDLWLDQPEGTEGYYPADFDRSKMFDGFAASRLTPEYRWYKNGHTMDLALRPGESLTRWWHPQGGRWFHPWPFPGDFDVNFLRKRFAEAPRGLKCKHRNWSEWTYGNGLFSYRPDLTSASADVDAGAYDRSGVEQTGDGIVSPDGGHIAFELRTPYIIVGRVKEMGPPPDIDGAAVLSYRSLGPLSVRVSTDNGLTWHLADRTPGPDSRTVDLTPHVLHTYGYLLRFDLDPGSGLADLALDTWTQLAPVSLPRLFEGENNLHVSLNDRYGYPTTVREIRINGRDPAHLERHLVRLDGDYQPLRNLSKITGDIVIRVDAKPGTGIRWLTAGGYFNTHHGSEAADNRNAIHWATSPDGPWKSLEAPPVPEWVGHWHYAVDGDIILDEPAEAVFLKYTGDPGLNQIWAYAHCEARSVARHPVRITYGYEENGALKEETFVVRDEHDTTITCAGEPVNRYLRFSVASQPAAAPDTTA